MKIYYKHSIPLTCISHSYICIHLCEFVVLGTISNSWMRSCGSFKIDFLMYFWEVQTTHPYIMSDCDILYSAREVTWNMQSSAVHFKIVFCVTVTLCEVTCVITSAVCILSENGWFERKMHALFLDTCKAAAGNYKALQWHWFSKFGSGATSVNDGECLVCSSVSRTYKNKSFHWNRHATICDLADDVRI